MREYVTESVEDGVHRQCVVGAGGLAHFGLESSGGRLTPGGFTNVAAHWYSEYRTGRTQ